MKNHITTAVIATIKDDAKGLRALLDDLLLQTHQPTEIIMVFAGIDSESEKVLQSYAAFLPLKHHVLKPEATRSQARNYGVSKAQSDIIIFTDAGCHPDKNWIHELIQPFAIPNVQLVSGYTGVWSQSDWELAQAAFVLVPRKKIEEHPLPATRNMAILRSTFLETSGFRDGLNFAEDFEFSRRLRSLGIDAAYAPKALVSWRPRSTYLQFFFMILKLTAGDMQSGMLRHGHISMLMRYSVFFGIFLLIWSLLNLQNAIFFTILIYVSYIAVKAKSALELSLQQRLWFVTFVPICDAAVLCGMVFGLAARTKARENRAV